MFLLLEHLDTLSREFPEATERETANQFIAAMERKNETEEAKIGEETDIEFYGYRIVDD